MLAFSHVSNAAAALENGRGQNAAASLLSAHYQSEGFIELSETYCSLVIDKAHLIAGEMAGLINSARLVQCLQPPAEPAFRSCRSGIWNWRRCQQNSSLPASQGADTQCGRTSRCADHALGGGSSICRNGA